MKSGLVQLICANPKHAQHDGQGKDHLTVSDGVWAFCRRDSSLEGHVWEPTGGVAIDEILRTVRRHEAPRDAAV